MIDSIISTHQSGSLEKILELLMGVSLSNKKGQEDKFELTIDPVLYISSFVRYVHNTRDDDGAGEYYDELGKIFGNLQVLMVIDSSVKSSIQNDTSINNDEFKKKYYFDSGKNKLRDDTPGGDQIDLYRKFGGTYYVKYDKDKIKSFYEIIRKEKKLICHKGMIKLLVGHAKSLDIESFLDVMRIDKRYIFNDVEVLIYSIASSTRMNLAKMYHYFKIKHLKESALEAFNEEISFEEEVVLDTKEYSYLGHYRGFYFDETKDNYPTTDNNKIISSGLISYDPDKKQLRVGEKFFSFKSSLKQRTLLEFLLKNRGTHISSKDKEIIKIGALKSILYDMKKKLKNDGLDKLQMKKMFSYFEEEGVGYCRILL